MSLKDKISVFPTRHKRVDDISTAVDVDVYRETSPVEAARPSFSEQEIHRVEVYIGVSFSCNKVELRHAEANARTQLIHELYKDIRSEAYTALNAVMSGDKRSAIQALDRLIQSTNP